MFFYHVYKDFDAELDFTTDQFQKAIDAWAIYKSVGHFPYIRIEEDGRMRETLNSQYTIKAWADSLILNYKGNEMNRVEKRIIKEIAEEQGYNLEEYCEKETNFRDEIPNLMGKVFGGSEELHEKILKEMDEHLKDIDFHGAFEEMSKEEQDQIINPKHYKMIPKEAYTKFPEGLEYMDLMEYILAHHNGVQSHLLGQVFKYACRLGKKDAKLQDAKKIAWYANRLVEVIENE